MKKIVCMLSLLLVISACGTSTDYNRNTDPGQVVPITYTEFLAVKDDKKTAVVIFTLTTCGYCKEYLADVIDPYLEDHGLNVYEVIIDKEENAQEVWDTLKAEWKDKFEGTPTTVILKDGKVELVQSGVLTKDAFDNLVTDFELDRK